MAIDRSYRLRWQPRGCSDSLDANNSFPGSMTMLSNLIPDPSTNDSWVCRPNAVQLTAFAGLSSPGFVSSEIIVGNIAYGTIATSRNSGKDEPYAYNIATNTVLTINGITNANSPTSPPTTGDWTPPILAAFNSRIMFTHPGFPGGATKIGWLDISGFSDATHTGNTHGTTTVDSLSADVLQAGWQPGMRISDSAGDIPANTTILSIASNGLSLVLSTSATGGGATGTTFTVTGGTATNPLWAAGDLNINNLPSVPVSVANFNERAYYACGVNGIVFSDSGVPTNRTNATQALTPGNGEATTALGPGNLSVITGGSVSALYAFQGVSNVIQITGDAALNNLATAVLPVATGTLAPLSIIPFNQGLAFISPDGMRVIDLSGRISNPIGDHGTGFAVPFIYAQNPSRICGAANADTLRWSVKRGDVGGNPTQELWYDLTRQVWSGPHSFPFDQLQGYMDTFIGAPTGVPGKLFQSDAVPSSINTDLENGNTMTWSYQTVLLPDDQDMMMTAVIETSITLALGAASATFSFFDDMNTLLDSVFFSGIVSGTEWDAFDWDQANWDSQSGVYRQRRIDWHIPLFFKQGYFSAAGDCDPSFRIGNLSLRYQRLGYQQQVA